MPMSFQADQAAMAGLRAFVLDLVAIAGQIPRKCEAPVSYQTLNRVSGMLPPILSAASIALIVFAMTTGWGKGRGDEGAAAHLFQLMMAAQLPLMAVFLVTADWRGQARVFAMLFVQLAAIAAVFAVGAYFGI
jgi:hypothetical protein